MFNTCCCVYIYLSVCVLSCVLRLLINKRASADKLSDEKMVIQNSSLLLCVTSFIENLFFSFFFFPSFSFLFFLLLFLSFWLFVLLMDNSPHLLYPTHSLLLLLLLLLLLAEETHQRDRDVSERKTRKNNI